MLHDHVQLIAISKFTLFCLMIVLNVFSSSDFYQLNAKCKKNPYDRFLLLISFLNITFMRHLYYLLNGLRLLFFSTTPIFVSSPVNLIQIDTQCLSVNLLLQFFSTDIRPLDKLHHRVSRNRITSCSINVVAYSSSLTNTFLINKTLFPHFPNTPLVISLPRGSPVFHTPTILKLPSPVDPI